MPESLVLSSPDRLDRLAADTHPEQAHPVHRAWRIRTSLALLVVACLLPGVLFSSYFIVSDYREQKATAIQSAIAIARAGAASLDQDIAGVISALRVLATSPALGRDDLSTFYNQAQSALAYQNITNYVLQDSSGRQLLNTLQPWGAPLPNAGRSAHLQRIMDSDEPVLTNLFTGPVANRPILAIGVPVKRDGRFVYSLNAGILPQRFTNVLHAQNLPPEWISAVMDGQYHIVARSRDMDRFLGKPAVPALASMAEKVPEGVLEISSLEGIPLIVVFSHSKVSDWSVAVGIPREKLTGELKRSLITLLAVNIVVFATALWVAWRLAVTGVMAPATQLLKRMRRMARGEAPEPADLRRTPHEFAMLEQGFADMSARLQEREKELEARLAAEAANRAKTTFLSRMSHELRTPLNAVLGFTQVLKLDPNERLSQRQLDMVRQIEASGQHLLAMISDVLDVSRIESGQMKMDLEAVDADALVEECRQMMAPDVLAASLHLDVRVQDAIGMVRADRTRLKQVLLNLLSNAAKYNKPQGRITLSVQREGPSLRFTVADTGLGMTPEQAAHLFEPFNRLGRHSTGTPGTGIGLVICKQLLELMGATLTVHTEAGVGSTFSFELPSCA